MISSYMNPILCLPYDIHEHSCDKDMGFSECCNIMLKIKNAMMNHNDTIFINDCEFIEQISIIYHKKCDHIEDYNEDDIYVDDSKLISYKDKKLSIKLTHYNWNIVHLDNVDDELFMGFFYEKIRYSLLIAYYMYLKEINSKHDFVKLVEFLSRVDFYEIKNRISLEQYIKSLKETKQSPIDEELFKTVGQRYRDIYFSFS